MPPEGSLERLRVSVGSQILVSVAPQESNGILEGILCEPLGEPFILDPIGAIRIGVDREGEGFLGGHDSPFVRGSLGIP
jgi:hypothetical protein